LDAAPRYSPRLRLLRVLGLVAAVAIYCARHAPRLFMLVWFPSLLATACLIVLDGLVYVHPPPLPDWLVSQHFNPPTWLTAIVTTPFGAMAWAFVLSDMADRGSHRGLVTARLLRRAGLRFELSRAVLVAAAIFSAVNLLDGVTRVLHFKLLVAAYTAFDMSDDTAAIWSIVGHAIRAPIVVALTAWAYLLAGHVLRSGTFDMGYVWRLTRGNRLRLFAIFLLLSLASIALDQLAAPATTWLTNLSFTIHLSWTVQGAMIRHFTDLPLSILWTAAYAVTVGIVLDVLERRR
jgi:hypothetical protein